MTRKQMTQKALKETLITLPPAAEGRKYLCIGPFCWGADTDAAVAVENAKRNYSKTYYPTWGFILYECGRRTTVNGIDGGYSYYEEDGAPKEVLRYRFPEEKAAS